ncbi:MAG: addiction module protein [Okeania sp. SIO3I5]|uniref:addiction module protein n=1 Tax=Okeania sp. SIO3I5 TaxID=2607805 RepID=UPI0013BD6E17|nr:addiction module protein [Okeania sp. SIO3I5]NEQ41249.1 addiction module protein [Okeania sp. SIO3I5]
MTTQLIEQILQLSISERLELIENIWNSITDIPDAIELTEKQKQELDYRLELYEQNSARGSNWEEVKQRIKNRK